MPSRSRRAAIRRDSQGPMTTSTQPTPISTGTIASNAEGGSHSSSRAPTIPPSSEAMPTG